MLTYDLPMAYVCVHPAFPLAGGSGFAQDVAARPGADSDAQPLLQLAAAE